MNYYTTIHMNLKSTQRAGHRQFVHDGILKTMIYLFIYFLNKTVIAKCLEYIVWLR